jgi:ketosteroid isomerase-like protein
MTSAANIARQYWELMNTNDFRSVGALLSDDFILEWPQSRERIRGRDNLAAMNEEYPRHGRWSFNINRLFGDETAAVSDVFVTDGVQKARVISFFKVADGKICEMVEYWPDDFVPRQDRRHLVELF